MSEIHPLIRALYDIAARNDRAALAELRRGLANPPFGLPFISRYLSEGSSPEVESALMLVAELFALHPKPGAMSLARALAGFAHDSQAVEMRFQALLAAELEGLPSHLRHAVALARTHDVAFDYQDLLSTVLTWEHRDKNAQRAWARDFWGGREPLKGTAP